MNTAVESNIPYFVIRSGGSDSYFCIVTLQNKKYIEDADLGWITIKEYRERIRDNLILDGNAFVYSTKRDAIDACFDFLTLHEAGLFNVC